MLCRSTSSASAASAEPTPPRSRLGTIGLPLADTNAKIVDPDSGKELGDGEVGELVIKGPQVMKGYVENFGPTIVGLTGTPEQIAAAARAYRVYYQKVPSKDGAPYLMDHSSIVYLLDRRGRFITHFTHETKSETIAQALKGML